MTDSNGHNHIGISQAEWDHYDALHSDVERREKQLKAEKNQLRKDMKTKGFKMKLFDASRTLANLTRDEQIEYLTHQQYYLRYSRSPVGEQMEFGFGEAGDAFDEASDEDVAAQLIDDAAGAGWRAGMAGEVFEKEGNPHEANTPAGQAWIKGYREAQKKQTMALKKRQKQLDKHAEQAAAE